MSDKVAIATLAVNTNAFFFFFSKRFGIISLGSNQTTCYCHLSVGKTQVVLFELEAAIQ